MEVPQPPQDEELKNIIQKLAVFVARNGAEFEAMTKLKQQGNSRFAFLYGGEFYNYYMYRVTTEQAILKHKSSQQQQQQQRMNNMGMNQGGQMLNFGGQQQQTFVGQQQQSQNFGAGGGLPQHQRFPAPLFDQPPAHMQQNQPPAHMQQNQPPRHISRFDRGPGPGQIQGFERSQMRMPFQNQQQNFENLASSTFERGPQGQIIGLAGQGSGSANFEFNTGGFENRGPPSNRGNFENRGPPSGSGRFDIGPPGNFENAVSTPSGRGRFDIGPSGNFENPGPPPPSSGRGRFDIPPQGNFDTSSGPLTSSGGGGHFDVAPPGSFDNTVPQGFAQNFQKQPNIPPVSNPPQTSSSVPPSANLNIEIDSLKTQKLSLEEQIKQSEQNLAGQNQVLMTQQQQQIDESIRILQDAEIKQLAAELSIDLSELDAVLQPIVESCTKDSISGGKAWIFTHTSTPRHYQLLSLYLLRKTTDPEAAFTKRLHIIYLVNDVLHHCMRKGAEDLQQVLEAMVIPMFCHAKVKEAGNEENLTKLNKLLLLWESKSQYVSPVAVEKLRDSNNTWLEYHSELLKRHAVVVTQIAQNISKTYEGYQAQHQIFCQHVLQNIKSIDQKMQQLILQQQFQLAAQQQQQQQQQQMNNLRNSLPAIVPQGIQNIPPPGLIIPGSQPPPLGTGASSSSSPALPITTGYPTGHVGPTQSQAFMQNIPSNQTHGLDHPPGVPILDISRPPPGFAPSVSEKDLMPALPYYELPAGLMVPLVKPEDDNYKPMDPKAIRLPPPCPPSERLLQAVEAFYGPPSHERPRDSEGWERLGLYEYFKSKNLARKQKEDDIREGRREKSRSPSPIRRDSSPSGRSPPRRRYQSKSPTPIRRRRSRSRSPSSSRRKNRRRSRSRSPGRRSPTPPSFGMASLGMDKKLDESNKGHQLLKKMGWGGSGLGANEQGIEAPISGGEIREKKDLYRGVGISMNDPFESYRKSKGQAFVERMRQRAEDRP